MMTIRLCRSRSRRVCFALILVFGALLIVDSVEATRRDKTPAIKKSGAKSRSIFGFVYGDFMSADITFENKDAPYNRFVINEDFGTGFGIFLDFPLKGDFSVGVAADIIGLPMPIANSDAMNLSFFTKYNILINSKKAALRPTLGIGFAYADKVALAGGAISEMTVNYGLEGIAFPTRGLGVIAQFGWWRGVSGGSSSSKVTVGALPYLRVGIAFGRFAI